jgi:hypothetical protein
LIHFYVYPMGGVKGSANFLQDVGESR